MRAKTVNSTSHIFDLDDTLIKSDVKTHVYRNGKFFKSLNAAEYNVYKKQPGDTFDMSDFETLNGAVTHIMWPLLEKYDKENNSVLYILTARHEIVRQSIYDFLIENGIRHLPIENIFAIGDNEGEIDIPREKRKVLEIISKQHSENNFYDDNFETIEFIRDIPNIRAYLVE